MAKLHDFRTVTASANNFVEFAVRDTWDMRTMQDEGTFLSFEGLPEVRLSGFSIEHHPGGFSEVTMKIPVISVRHEEIE